MTDIPVSYPETMREGAVSAEELDRPLYGATFPQAVKRFFKNYAKFSGRASRSEFWWAELFLILIGIVPWSLFAFGFSLTVLSELSAETSGEVALGDTNPAGVAFLVIGWVIALVIGLAVLVPTLALWWRRLHDANYSGLMYLLNFIPVVGSIIVLVFACLPSRPEGRRFDLARKHTSAAPVR